MPGNYGNPHKDFPKRRFPVRWITFILILLLPVNLTKNSPLSRLILWNVGQGQWVTYLKQETCYHLDIGGENLVHSQALHLCRKKQNILYLSHPDWDHIGGIRPLKKKLPNLCLIHNLHPLFSTKELSFLNSFPRCQNKDTAHPIQIITPKFRSPLKKSKNDRSYVFLIEGQILIPGDSTLLAERSWVKHLSHPQSIHTLILGHHGSRTSTSQGLINALPYLKRTLVSARHKKYGHPHREVLKRLKKNHLPLVGTEEWNHIELDVIPLR